eukprot:3713743-Rhodomonas_salina.1
MDESVDDGMHLGEGTREPPHRDLMHDRVRCGPLIPHSHDGLCRADAHEPTLRGPTLVAEGEGVGTIHEELVVWHKSRDGQEAEVLRVDVELVQEGEKPVQVGHVLVGVRPVASREVAETTALVHTHVVLRAQE